MSTFLNNNTRTILKCLLVRKFFVKWFQSSSWLGDFRSSIFYESCVMIDWVYSSHLGPFSLHGVAL